MKSEDSFAISTAGDGTLLAKAAGANPATLIQFPNQMNPDFREAIFNDPTVFHMVRRGRPLEEIIGQLYVEKGLLMDYISRLEAIAPRKLVKADGTVLVSHVPAELIPDSRTIHMAREESEPNS